MPSVRHELELAEAEVRLTRLLNSLLTLARDGDRPALRVPVSCAAPPSRRMTAGGRGPRRAGTRSCSRDGDALVRAADEDVAITLDNLIENAIVYAPAGTTVTVTGCAGTPAVLDEAWRRRATSAGSSERFRRSHQSARHRAQRDRRCARAASWGGSASIRMREDGTGSRAEVVLPLSGPS